MSATIYGTQGKNYIRSCFALPLTLPTTCWCSINPPPPKPSLSPPRHARGEGVGVPGSSLESPQPKSLPQNAGAQSTRPHQRSRVRSLRGNAPYYCSHFATKCRCSINPPHQSHKLNVRRSSGKNDDGMWPILDLIWPHLFHYPKD